MAKRLTEKQIDELDHLNEWCLSILNYIVITHGENSMFLQYIEVVVEAYQKQKLEVLRRCLKDVNEWAKGLSKSDINELNKLLTIKFGYNLSKPSNKLTAIIQRGKINSEDEYRLLLNRIDEIYENETNTKELETLNKLLADYHK